MKDFDRFFQTIYEQPLTNRKSWYADSTIAYAQYRAPYVPSIIDFVCEQLPTATQQNGVELLEIGSGPGNGTQHFLRKGYRLTCVEPNSTACEFMATRFIDYPTLNIVNNTFEECSLKSRQFDAAIASTSFHWLNPETRCSKVAEHLKPQGKIILIWCTAPQPTPEIYHHLEPIYLEYLPTFADYENLKTQEKNILNVSQSVIESGYFTDLHQKQTINQQVYTVDEYLSLLTTLSPYIALAEHRRNEFFVTLRHTFNQHQISTITTQYVCAAHIATKLT